MAAVRMTRKEKLLLLEVAGGCLTTARWRQYVPLSIKGLVEIDKSEAETWSDLWGVTCAVVTLTERGRAALDDIDRDVEVWHAIANAHADRYRTSDRTKNSRCLCGACMAAWRMRPAA